MNLLNFSIRIGVALLFGATIGLERQWRQRGAGLRTNALVATGAAAFVSLSTLVEHENSPTRIASYVVSGIGFLGAGVIMREGMNVRGLNTAATLWCSAAAGVLTGWGFIAHAAITTTAVIGCHLLLRPIGRLIDRQPLDETSEVDVAYQLQAVCREADELQVRGLLLQEVDRESLRLKSLSSEDINGSGKVRVEAELITTGRSDKVIEQVISRLSLEPSITSISWEIVEHPSDG
jgi:putative Mg2+ transporter-C (MgtC) family protein